LLCPYSNESFVPYTGTAHFDLRDARRVLISPPPGRGHFHKQSIFEPGTAVRKCLRLFQWRSCAKDNDPGAPIDAEAAPMFCAMGGWHAEPNHISGPLFLPANQPSAVSNFDQTKRWDTG